jgi:Domain of unknown function (DUF4352)
MFCSWCGREISASAPFCCWCGRRPPEVGHPAGQPHAANPSTEVQAKQTTRPLRAIGAVVIVGLIVGLLGIWVLSRPENQPAAVESPAASVQASAKHRTGEDFSVGYWSYRCNGSRWQQTIGSGFGGAESPDATFLVVDLAVRNNDKTSSTLPPLKLVDAEGREYDESSKSIFMERSFGMLKEVNPGVTSRGYLVFDVPRRGDYALQVSGGFASGERALVDLVPTAATR